MQTRSSGMIRMVQEPWFFPSKLRLFRKSLYLLAEQEDARVSVGESLEGRAKIRWVFELGLPSEVTRDLAS